MNVNGLKRAMIVKWPFTVGRAGFPGGSKLLPTSFGPWNHLIHSSSVETRIHFAWCHPVESGLDHSCLVGYIRSPYGGSTEMNLRHGPARGTCQKRGWSIYLRNSFSSVNWLLAAATEALTLALTNRMG